MKHDIRVLSKQIVNSYRSEEEEFKISYSMIQTRWRVTVCYLRVSKDCHVVWVKPMDVSIVSVTIYSVLKTLRKHMHNEKKNI
jgi:hypothetical protein